MTIPCRINCYSLINSHAKYRLPLGSRSTLVNDFLSVLWRNPPDIQHVLQRCLIQIQWTMQCGHDSAQCPTVMSENETTNCAHEKSQSPNTKKNTQIHKVTNDINTVHGSHTKAKANITTLVQVISECLCPDATSGYHGNQQQSPHVTKCTISISAPVVHRSNVSYIHKLCSFTVSPSG